MELGELEDLLAKFGMMVGPGTLRVCPIMFVIGIIPVKQAL